MCKPIPVIDGKPLIGNLLDFRTDRLGLLLRISRTCGDIGSFYIGPTKKILVNSAPLVHKILMAHSNSLDKSLELRKFGTPLLGNGMLISNNSDNRKQRRLVAPAFQPQRMKAYTEVTAEYSEQICRTWCEGQKIDVYREMARLTLWTVGKNMFNADVLSEADELGSALTQAITGFDSQLRALVPLTIQWPTPTNIAFARAIRRLNKTTLALIAKRKIDPGEHKDLLSMLLNASYEDGSPMTDLQVQDEVVNFFMAGFETSATALTWAWYLLSQHPAIYARLRDEADAVLRGRTPTSADLPELRYTLQVLKEVLRLYPPVHVFQRRLVEAITVDDYYLPSGSTLVFSPFAMHRRPDYFPDPGRFDPDRFSPENERRLFAHSWIPFGAGRRTCIGNQYALMNGEITLATLAQRVVLDTKQPFPECDPMITLRPKQPVEMVVSHRALPPIETPPLQYATVAEDGSRCPFAATNPNPVPTPPAPASLV